MTDFGEMTVVEESVKVVWDIPEGIDYQLAYWMDRWGLLIALGQNRCEWCCDFVLTRLEAVAAYGAGLGALAGDNTIVEAGHAFAKSLSGGMEWLDRGRRRVHGRCGYYEIGPGTVVIGPICSQA